MNSVLAIDPGPTESAYVLFDGSVREKGMLSNPALLEWLRKPCDISTVLAIEQVACMGMAVGAEVFETVFWSGRFAEAWTRYPRGFHRIKRHQVKMHLCGNMRAKDANIRQALIDKLGAPGKKKSPGATYGISGDCWSALAVAVTFLETSLDPELQNEE